MINMAKSERLSRDHTVQVYATVDKKMSNRDKGVFIRDARMRSSAHDPVQAASSALHLPLNDARAEAGLSKLNSRFSTKLVMAKATLQSATVDLTSKGLLVCPRGTVNPALKFSLLDATARCYSQTDGFKASSDDKKKARKALVDSKYVNVNSLMVSAVT